MKSKHIIAIIFSLAIFLFPMTFYASPPLTLTISGEAVSFTDQTPTIVDGRTLVPVRDVFETLGYRTSWEPNTQTVTLQNVHYTVTIEIDSNVFTTNGEEFALDVPAQIINGRTMLPIRSILESVGFYVDWDASTSTIAVTTGIWLDIVPVPVATGGRASFAIRDDGSLWACA